MKKLAFLFFFASCMLTSQAQFIVGGNLGYNHWNNGGERGGTAMANESKSNVFNFDLRGGYCLSDRMQVGITAGYKIGDTVDVYCASPDIYSTLYTEKVHFQSFEIGVYFRYDCFTMGKFTLFAELQSGYTTSTGKINTDFESDPSLNTEIDRGKSNGFYAEILPGLNYRLNEHVSIDLNLGFLGFGYETKQVKKTINNEEDIQRSNRFGLNLKTGGLTLFDFIQDVTFGVNYKF